MFQKIIYEKICMIEARKWRGQYFRELHYFQMLLIISLFWMLDDEDWGGTRQGREVIFSIFQLYFIVIGYILLLLKKLEYYYLLRLVILNCIIIIWHVLLIYF